MTDDALIEAMARAMLPDNRVVGPYLHAQVKAALAVARPVIERETRERCARIAEDYFHHPDDAKGVAAAIAAAIRSDGDE